MVSLGTSVDRRSAAAGDEPISSNYLGRRGQDSRLYDLRPSVLRAPPHGRRVRRPYEVGAVRQRHSKSRLYDLKTPF